MSKFKMVFLFLLGSLEFQAQTVNSEKITWPTDYEPSKSRFYVHNEIEIKAAPEKVWAILIDALQWPGWYEGAKDLSFVEPADTVLDLNRRFRWKTMGLRLESAVREWQPNQLLAWESRKKSIQAYHVWLIIPTATGCKVITDESQNGWLTFFEKLFQRNKLRRLHDLWLLELKKKAEQKAV